MLAESHFPRGLWRCDALELRLDGLPVLEILRAAQGFSTECKKRLFKGFIILTLRLQRDGGLWEDECAQEREKVWMELADQEEPLGHFFDLEIEQASNLSPELWRKIKRSGFRVLWSHHALIPESPEMWELWLEEMRKQIPDAVKFAVMVLDREVALQLLNFATQVAKEFPLSCVIGMGEAGRSTRVLGPLMGCPITYAFVEEGPVASGQLHLGTLQSLFQLAQKTPPLAQPSEWLDWADGHLKELVHDA